MAEKIPILYQDSSIIIVDKPAGLFIHPNQYTQNKPNCVNILGGIVQKKVLTCHRLDRRTSGAVVFALRKDAASHVTTQFKHKEVKKRYLALVRGYLDEEVYTNRPIKDFYSNEKKYLEAESKIRPLAHGSLPDNLVPEDMKDIRETRFSLVEVELYTGKTHQARSHLSALSHPVIGDNLHGDKRQNNLFQEVFHTEEMFLRSAFLEFLHPADKKTITVTLGPAKSWRPILEQLQFPAEYLSPSKVQVRIV